METKISGANLVSAIFGFTVFAIGILNIFYVHPVPGITFLILSLLFFPGTNAYLKNNFNFTIPLIVKIILFLIIIMFTLGVSDLGDMFDAAFKD